MATQLVVPLDGSRLAEQALPCAMILGAGLPAELILFHAVDLSPDRRRRSEAKEQAEAKANEYLGRIAAQMHEAGLSARGVVQHGPAAETIVDYADQVGAQFIVMSTHGYTGIQRCTHGSVAERVSQSANVPVLMVRASEESPDDSRQPRHCQHILVPLDGSETAEQALPSATAVAQAVGAKVTLFRVVVVQPAATFGEDWPFVPSEGGFDEDEREAQAYLEGVADRLREQGIQVSTAAQIGPVAESIVKYAEANQVDVVAMCTHGRTGLAHWAFGSVAGRVLRAGSRPILLVRAR